MSKKWAVGEGRSEGREVRGEDEGILGEGWDEDW